MNKEFFGSKLPAKIKPGTKILFACVPADGHFNPLTGLAVYLKEQGCDVRWYTSANYEEKVMKLGLQFYPLVKAMDIAVSTDPDIIFPERKNYKTQVSRLKFDLINVFILRGPEYFEDILDIHQQFPFELMIADITFGAIPFVKERMNIPVLSINIVPLPETSRDLPPPGLGMLPSKSAFGKARQAFLRYVADKLLFAKPNKVLEETLGKYGISSEGANIFDIQIRKSSAVLQSGTPGFEYERSDMSPHIHFAGPLLPHSAKKSSAPWFNEKLRSYNKVILVTQGTVEKDVNKIIVPTLEAFKNSDCLVIVTTGGSQTAELRNRYPQENFIIEDFIPFGDVMPYADVYVTNGGYGGVLLSIQNNLPLVVAGVHEGKLEINARVGYFKLGINLRTEKPSAAAIRKSVDKILSDDSYRKNVKALSREFRQYDLNQVAARVISQLLPSFTPVREKAYEVIY